jgi:hypothetical protein
MKLTTKTRPWILVLILACATTGTAPAYPPAPHHLFFGLVRDEMGTAISLPEAEVILETLSGAHFRTFVLPQVEPGVNYRMAIPMDAGLTADNYRPNALRPTVPFRMRVKIGSIVYLPIEMTGSLAHVGEPAQSTRIDLTIGVDSDGDGLPDAWEYALIAALGGNLTLSDINPHDDADADGLTNLQEYLAGTYVFDPEDGFRLELIEAGNEKPIIEFLAIRGRTYTLHASDDLQSWAPVEFRIVAHGADALQMRSYTAPDVRMLRIEVIPPEKPGPLFFKAVVH